MPEALGGRELAFFFFNSNRTLTDSKSPVIASLLCLVSSTAIKYCTIISFNTVISFYF